jgi:AcrR family transcriptional regulator
MTHRSPQASDGRRGRPARLSRELIVSAARTIVRRQGVDALTMRRLAEEIGCNPMSLYGHINDKAGLLLLILEAEAQELQWPNLPHEPRDRIITAALFIHDTLVDRPWALEAVWPGEAFSYAVLPLAEEILASFIASSFTPTAAAHAYRSIWFLIIGELRSRHGPTPKSVHKRRLTHINRETTPNVDHLASRWQDTDSSYNITDAITAFVDGLIAHNDVGPG